MAAPTDQTETGSARTQALSALPAGSQTSADWNNRGVWLFRIGLVDHAAECFKNAFEADPRNLGALENLVELCTRSRRYDSAAVVASGWLRSHRRCASDWIAWAKLNLLAGKMAAARGALTRALELDPGNSAVRDALNSIGNEIAEDLHPIPKGQLHPVPGELSLKPALRETARPLPNTRPEARVPTVSVEELLDSSVTIALAELAGVDGNVKLLELAIIAFLVRKSNPQLTLEIGTFDGRTTLNMALNQNPGTEVVTLDLPASQLGSVAKQLEEEDKTYVLKQNSGSKFEKRKTPARIVQLYGDSATYDFSPYQGRVDLMFVDGSHSYDYALNDSILALSLVHAGGTVLWHDYDMGWYGVTQALNHLLATNSAFRDIKHIAGTSLCLLRT